MRHRSTMPRRTIRVSGAQVRGRLRVRKVLRAGRPRLLLGVLVTVGITALFLAVPVVSGKVTDPAPVALESSASAARASSGSPVVMGEDGVPLPGQAVPGGTGTRSAGSSSADAAGTAASSARPGGAGGPLSSLSSSGTSRARATSPRSATHSPTAAGTPSSPNALPGSPGATSAGTSDPGAPTVAAPAPGTVPASAAAQVLALVNAERVTASCAPLAIDAGLTETATADSAAMQNGSAPDQAVAAVAHGTSDPAAVVAGWLADPTDRAALLDCTRTTAGLGLAAGTGGPWWTLLLGS